MRRCPGCGRRAAWTLFLIKSSLRPSVRPSVRPFLPPSLSQLRLRARGRRFPGVLHPLASKSARAADDCKVALQGRTGATPSRGSAHTHYTRGLAPLPRAQAKTHHTSPGAARPRAPPRRDAWRRASPRATRARARAQGGSEEPSGQELFASPRQRSAPASCAVDPLQGPGATRRPPKRSRAQPHGCLPRG